MTDEDLQSQIGRERGRVKGVISSLSTAPTQPYTDGPRARRSGRSDASDDACEAVMLDVDSDPDTDSDTDTDTEADRRPLRYLARRPDPDADLRPAESVSAEAEVDVLDQVRQLAEAVDLSLAIGSRLLRRARPAAGVVAVVSGLLVLVGGLIGVVFTLASCLLVLR